MKFWTLLALVLLCPAVSAVGIGVSPSSLHFERKHTEKTLTVFNLGEGEAVYEVDGTGFEPIRPLTIGAKSRIAIPVKLNGDQTSGEIKIRQKLSGDGVSITPAAIVSFTSGVPKKRASSAYFKSTEPDKGFFVGFLVFVTGFVIYSIISKLRKKEGSESADFV